MRFYPYYIYEKNEAGNLCNVSLSIQSVLTQSGRVCFAVLADCKNMSGEVASYTSAYLVKELTKWFWEKGIELADVNHTVLHNGMLRALQGISEELQKFPCYEAEKFCPGFACIIICRKKYYVWSFGDVGLYLFRHKFRKGNLKTVFNNQYSCKKSRRRNNKRAIYHTTGKINHGYTFFLCNPVITGFCDEERIKELLKTGSEHAKIKRRFAELQYRIRKTEKSNDLGAVCIVTDK